MVPNRLKNIGPGMMISAALHLIVIGAVTIAYVNRVHRREELVPQRSYLYEKVDLVPPDLSVPREIVRYSIPRDMETQLVASTDIEQGFDPDWSPVETIDDGEAPSPSSEGDLQGTGEWFTSSVVGNNSGRGSAIGVGSQGSRPGGRGGPGRNYRGTPGARGSRGESQRTEAAVLYGLTWLARHQANDGSWDAVAYQDRCRDASCTGPGHVRFSDGLTSLALLAFLGAGYAHDSKQFVLDPVTREKISFGDVVKRGLKYLVAKQQPDGAFGNDHFMYNQALCAMAVAEAYALTGSRYFREPAEQAIRFIERAQNSDPQGTGSFGWRYQPLDGMSDTSVTGWCVMALKSGELANLGVDHQAMEGGLKWVKCATNSDFKAGYLSAADAGQKIDNPEELGRFDHHESMTAVAMMVRTFVTFDWRDPALLAGANLLVNDLPTWEPQAKRDFYYWYYASLALNQYSGPDSPNPNKSYWNKWNEKLVAAIVNHQENVPPNQATPKDYVELFKEAGEKACKTGSWEPTDRYGYAGRIYSTAINVLSLEVYYRFDNAFGSSKRQTSGKSEEKKPAPAPEEKKEEKPPEKTDGK
jgi:hypothetical protein